MPDALISHITGNYSTPGSSIIHFAEYPSTTADIKAWLDKLLAMNCPLAIDIEGFDLKHHKAGIGTISFAWNKHEGIAFAVDYISEEWVGKVVNPVLMLVMGGVIGGIVVLMYLPIFQVAEQIQ